MLHICNIKVMKLFLLVISMVIQSLFWGIGSVRAYNNPSAVTTLGTITNFAALAATSVSSPIAGTTLNNGNLGINAGCTDFPSPCTTPGVGGSVVNGVIHNENGTATIGQTDATAAVGDLNGRGANATIAGGLLDGLTLAQGVYDVPATGTNLTGVLTLNGDANSIFIFRFPSTFVTGSTASVVLTGGAQACNVYWTSVAGTTINDTTSIVGSIFAGTSITFPGGGATVNGRVIAQTGAITFNNTTVNNSSCAAAASSTSASSSSSDSSASSICIPNSPVSSVATTILEARRVSPTSIYLSWGPYAGLDTFNIRYGTKSGEWLYNYNFTGFSATITDLPPNQPFWFQVAARNNCIIGEYGEARLVGAPKLPDTGIAPHRTNLAWYIIATLLLLPALFLKAKHVE